MFQSKSPAGLWAAKPVESSQESRIEDVFSSRFIKYYKPVRMLEQNGNVCVFEAEKILFNEFKFKETCAIKRIPVRGSQAELDKKLEEVKALASTSLSPNDPVVKFTDAWIERPPVGWQKVADEKIVMAHTYQTHIIVYEDDCAFMYIEMPLCEATFVLWLSPGKRQELQKDLPSVSSSPAQSLIPQLVSKHLNPKQNVKVSDFVVGTTSSYLANPFLLNDFYKRRMMPEKHEEFAAPQVEEVYSEELEEDLKSEFNDLFEPMGIVGEGGYGCVFQVQKKVGDAILNINRAIKRITLKSNQSDLRNALREVEALVLLDHPGIVKIYGSWTEEPFLYIQMELCQRTLDDWLSTNDVRACFELFEWFKQIVSAVAYIHKNGKIHRDLKPSNILIGSNNQLKICDFGIVTDRAIENVGGEEEIAQSRTMNMGTKKYMAPEQSGWSPYSSKVDIFALGLILAEMSVKMTRDEAGKVFDNYRDGKPNDILDNLPKEKEFVEWLANPTDTERPTCEEILERENIFGDLILGEAEWQRLNCAADVIPTNYSLKTTKEETTEEIVKGLQKLSIQRSPNNVTAVQPSCCLSVKGHKLGYRYFNRGTDCFAIAAVNSLFCLPSLMDDLALLPEKNYVVDMLLNAYTERRKSTTNGADLRPMENINPLRDYFFNDRIQHDASEMILMMIDCLELRRQDGSMIKDDFRVEIEMKVPCSGCEEPISWNSKTLCNFMLKIGFINGTPGTIEQLLRRRAIRESFGDSHAGSGCTVNNHDKTRKIIAVARKMPQYLLIALEGEVVTRDEEGRAIRTFHNIPLSGVDEDDMSIFGTFISRKHNIYSSLSISC